MELTDFHILARHESGETWNEIAESVGLDYETVRKRGYRAAKSSYAFGDDYEQDELHVLSKPVFPSESVPKSVVPKFDKPLQVPDENCLVIGDLHVPLHSELMLERAVYVVRRYYPHVRTCVIGGDLWDFDSISDHPKNYAMMDPNESLGIGGDVLRYLGNIYENTYIVPGNHDERFSKRLDKPFSMKRLIGAALVDNWPKGQLHISDLDYLYVGDHWVIGHPSSYSGQGGKTPAEYADLYQRNAIAMHNHLVGYAPSKSGKYIGIDSGHLTDPEKHFYAYRRFNKFTRWQSGFVVLSHGYAYPYTENFTDWRALGA